MVADKGILQRDVVELAASAAQLRLGGRIAEAALEGPGDRTRDAVYQPAADPRRAWEYGFQLPAVVDLLGVKQRGELLEPPNAHLYETGRCAASICAGIPTS